MLARLSLFLICYVLCSSCTAQTTASLSGTVIDAATTATLPGATVQVFIADTSMGTTADARGAFRITGLPTGIHRVRASFVGYAPIEVAEVWVRTGKEESIELQLQRTPNELGEVEVRAAAPRRMDAISTHALTVEQSLRYPATFFDPARLAMSFAGVASTNDQANHFSVRGNGPASNAWLLEGAEIVTPNHLTNAGTQSDYPTLSGGGTTILSAQMLGTSRLLLGGFSAAYGNALGGVMDLSLRAGTAERHRFTAQAGLIGIDLSTEGPFKKGKGATYLINYRYSTLGLLSSMGVALGDEKITFQDLSFNVSIPFKDKARLTFFGMGGNSSNRFDAKDSTEWEFDKDSQNIDYTAKVGVAGATFRLALGKHAVWRTTAVVSENDQERSADDLAPLRRGFIYGSERTALGERKLSFISYIRGASGTRVTYQLGGSAMERTVHQEIFGVENVVGWLIRPYAQSSYAITERLQAEVGLAYSYYTYNASAVVEPRLALRWSTRGGRSLSVSAGQRGQLPNVQSFPVAAYASVGIDNRSVGMTRAQELVVAYDHPFDPYLVLHAEAYIQHLQQVPWGQTALFNTGDGQPFSLTNAWDNYYFLAFTGRGEAWNKGLELGLTHAIHNGFFYQVNGTLLDARYKDIIGASKNSRWNIGGMGNVVVGREFVKQKETSKRIWGVNGRINGTGGQRYTPSPSQPSGYVEPYSAQYNTFYRVDVRIYRKMERKNHTGMWSLDVLNVTNAQNEAYHYFDQRKGEVVTKYQLGLIPNLSYRIEF
ncbi:MAG TPA: TonB-dependent receptor [Flavobacteriales bacterium]|nr:TonB-dependent receptor [Flavobacteriales bacterium]